MKNKNPAGVPPLVKVYTVKKQIEIHWISTDVLE